MDWDWERPDCIYHDNENHFIGIEIVNCFNDGNAVMEMRHHFETACKMCEDDLNSKGLYTSCYISVTFFGSIQRTKPKMKTDKFHKAIVEEIERHLKYDEYIETDKFLTDIEGYKKLNQMGAFDYQFVESVEVSKKQFGELEIHPFTMEFVPSIEADAVRKSISVKEHKLLEYRQLYKNSGIHEYWLFIALNWDSFTDLGDLQPIDISSEYKKIFICDYSNVKCLK